MNRKYSLLLAFAITGLIASNVYLFSFYSSREEVVVSKIIDGDTLILEDGRRIRLLNINAPEKSENGYNDASNYLSSLENRSISLEITGIDRYQRSLGRIYASGYVNLEIVKKGYAKKFLVQDSEGSIFAKAEEQAIENELGIWKKSEHFGCFNSNISEYEEFFTLFNICDPINVSGWVVKDESRKSYKFPDIALDSVTIRSKNGSNNATTLYWNSKTNIWNNDKDTLYLFDEKGKIVHYHVYGY